jgi:hypothetical protein
MDCSYIISPRILDFLEEKVLLQLARALVERGIGDARVW